MADGKLNEDVDLRTGSHEGGTLVREERRAYVTGLNCTFKLCPWHTFSKATLRKWGRQIRLNTYKHLWSTVLMLLVTTKIVVSTFLFY